MDTLDRIAVSPAEACKLTSTGPTKLYEALAAGDLRAVKMGRKTLIMVEDLKAWIQRLPAFQSGAALEQTGRRAAR
jgi:excisionase family DNA binding protein